MCVYQSTTLHCVPPLHLSIHFSRYLSFAPFILPFTVLDYTFRCAVHVYNPLYLLFSLLAVPFICTFHGVPFAFHLTFRCTCHVYLSLYLSFAPFIRSNPHCCTFHWCTLHCTFRCTFYSTFHLPIRGGGSLFPPHQRMPWPFLLRCYETRAYTSTHACLGPFSSIATKHMHTTTYCT